MTWKLPTNYRILNPAERKSVRQQYIAQQKGLCYWCQQPLGGDPSQEVMDEKIQMSLFPPNFLKYPIHLQHCHKTGMTEGAVHSRCNAVMWQSHGR